MLSRVALLFATPACHPVSIYCDDAAMNDHPCVALCVGLLTAVPLKAGFRRSTIDAASDGMPIANFNDPITSHKPTAFNARTSVFTASGNSAPAAVIYACASASYDAPRLIAELL